MKLAFAIAAVLVVVACAEADGYFYRRYTPSIYNRNTNGNKNENKDEAQVWSAIYDSVYSDQDVYQQQSQSQLCSRYPYYAFCGRRFVKRSVAGPHHGAADIYNVNTNLNTNKNKVEAEVWSRIYDRVAASQLASQAQRQAQY